MQASAIVSVYRATINQLNAQKSTGPRTEAGKQRSSLNSLRHGLTARTAVLHSEDPDGYQLHRCKFIDEYQPATRQFQKRLDQIRTIQYERRQHEKSQLKDAAALLELHKYKGLPWEPSDHGFVFSKEQVERCSERMMRQNEARSIGYVRFDLDPKLHENLRCSW
jgi:hypothetical protein